MILFVIVAEKSFLDMFSMVTLASGIMPIADVVQVQFKCHIYQQDVCSVIKLVI